jgi:hypothetical protein
MWTDPGNILIAQRHMTVEIGTEAAQFPEKEHINGIFVAVRRWCAQQRRYFWEVGMQLIGDTVLVSRAGWARGIRGT